MFNEEIVQCKQDIGGPDAIHLTPHHVVVDVEVLVLVVEHLDQVELPLVPPRPPGHEAEGGRGVGQRAQPLMEAGELVRGQAEVN